MIEKEGKDAYAQQKDVIERKRQEASTKLNALNEQRKAGTISQGDYERQVAELAG